MDYTPIDLLKIAGGDKNIAALMAKQLAKSGLTASGTLLCSMLTHDYLDRFITKDEEMNRLKNKVMRLSSMDIQDSVLIKGETGVGKELIAHALHGDRTGNFVGINCTSLPSELLESELFGHVKGAFTGAYCDKTGKFEYANNGTLFLDEIGDMPHSMQAKLLRALQERVITRLGSNEEIAVNVRIVCATNRLEIGNAEDKSFRKDLYYRLAAFELLITPLRSRPGDIEVILDKLDMSNRITKEIRNKICAHPLPGNARQLQSIVRRYIVLNELDI